jgi:Mg2+/Co2+ transporter CorC
LLLFIFFPLAYPLAKMLDHLVGVEDEELMTRDELMTMIRLTRSLAIQKLDKDAKRDRDTEKNEQSSINKRGEILMPSEVDAITGILTLTKKTVKDLMVPMEVVHMVSTDQVLDSATLSAIDRIGHSRLPVFKGSDRNFITGFLFVKKLITCAPNILLGSCPAIRTPIYIDSSRCLFEVFDMFQTGKSHIAIVSHNVTRLLNVFYANNQSPTPDCSPCGILTIEDIIEAILQEQIYDEEDETRNSISPTAMTSVLRALRKRGGGGGGGGGGNQKPALMRARSNTNTSFSSNLSGKNEEKTAQKDIFRRTYSTTAANFQEQHALENDFRITGTQSLLPTEEKIRSDSTSRPSEDYFVPSTMRNSRL